MEHAKDIRAVGSSDISFDGIEIVGLVVPLLFAVMAIVLGALAPESTGMTSEDPRITSDRIEQIEQIHKR